MAKVLFILFKDCSTSYDGGSQANMRNLQVSRQLLGAENVDCYYIHGKHSHHPILSKGLAASLFSLGYFNGLTPRKVKEIRRLSRNYDFVFISNSIFGLVAKRLKDACYKGKIITFFHNVESIYYESRVGKSVPLRQIIIDCAARNDRYALQYSDTVAGLCERDSRTLKRMYGKGFDLLVPITFKDQCPDTKFDTEVMTGSRPKCTFIGSNFPANAEGVLWFVKNVLPHVDIDFIVIGQNMNKLKEKNECLKNIPVYNSIPDLTLFWMEADFMIFPIFAGSGMKVKTCEALMYGKNILGTNEAFEGYELDANQCGHLCNTAKEFIQVIQALCEKSVRRYNPYSRQIFLEKYSTENNFKVVSEIFRCKV